MPRQAVLGVEDDDAAGCDPDGNETLLGPAERGECHPAEGGLV